VGARCAPTAGVRSRKPCFVGGNVGTVVGLGGDNPGETWFYTLVANWCVLSGEKANMLYDRPGQGRETLIRSVSPV